jgi:glycosyltransferase involved in cell wall biosynthesis
MNHTRFKIVVPSYNSYPWIEQTLRSVEEQTYKNYEVCVIDDFSSDPRQRATIDQFCRRNGWHPLYNDQRRKTLYNLVHGVRALECTDQDVIVVVDGDDWLYNKQVLERVDSVYQKEAPLITYGQYIHYHSGSVGCARKIRRRAMRWKRFRKMGWVFSHLRTYKYLLWRHIKDRDLRAPDGDYFATAGDLATMFPMLEMAGTRIKFIPEVLYVYNDLNPISDYRVALQEQEAANRYIRGLKKYKTLSLDLR